MKHDDVLGYTNLRAELFRLRFDLQLTKDEKERALVREKLIEVKRKMARLLYEDKLEKENKKGR